MIHRSLSCRMINFVPGRRTYSDCSLMIAFRKSISCGRGVIGEIYARCIASFPAFCSIRCVYSGLRLKNLGESTRPYLRGKGDMKSAHKVNSPFSTYVAA